MSKTGKQKSEEPPNIKHETNDRYAQFIEVPEDEFRIPTQEAAGLPLLLVEDDQANILVATAYLEYLGYRYELAQNGIEAVEKARTNHYAAIIMDVKMPGMNGYEATQLIRKFEAESDKGRTFIIGMTAHALIGDKERCITSGMDDYIAKPVSEDALRAKLNFIIPTFIPQKK